MSLLSNIFSSFIDNQYGKSDSGGEPKGTLDLKSYHPSTLLDFIYHKFSVEYREFANSVHLQYQKTIQEQIEKNRKEQEQKNAFNLDSEVSKALNNVRTTIEASYNKYSYYKPFEHKTVVLIRNNGLCVAEKTATERVEYLNSFTSYDPYSMVGIHTFVSEETLKSFISVVGEGNIQLINKASISTNDSILQPASNSSIWVDFKVDTLLSGPVIERIAKKVIEELRK